jgi:hypothetical protein
MLLNSFDEFYDKPRMYICGGISRSIEFRNLPNKSELAVVRAARYFARVLSLVYSLLQS